MATKVKRARPAQAVQGIDADAVKLARRALSKLKRSANRSTSRSGKDWSAVAAEQRATIKQLKKDLRASSRGEARALKLAQSFMSGISKAVSAPSPAEATTA